MKHYFYECNKKQGFKNRTQPAGPTANPSLIWSDKTAYNRLEPAKTGKNGELGAKPVHWPVLFLKLW